MERLERTRERCGPTYFPLPALANAFLMISPNRIEVVDPCRVQPEKFRALDPARAFIHFFLGDIFPERIVEPAGSLIGIEPGGLPLTGQ